MPRWLIITGIGCGGLLMLVLVGVGTLFFIAVEEELRKGPEASPGERQEQQTPDEAPEPRVEPPDTATILLSGDAAYHCNIGSVNESRSVEGVPPQEYEVAVDTGSFYERVSVYCWKPGGGEGTFGVQIVYDGQVRQEATTSAEYGNVNVSWTLQD